MNTPSVVLLLVAIIGLVWTLCLVPRRHGPGRRDLVGLLCGTAWWSACILGENLPWPLQTRVLCDHLAYFGMAITPCLFCFLLWNATFLGRRPVPPVWRAAAFAFAVFVGSAAVLNPYSLIDRSIEPAPGNIGPPRFNSGPLYYVIVAILYLAMFAMIGITARHQQGRSLRRRRLYLGIVAAMAAPMLVGALNVLFDLQYPAEDPTPFAFLVTAPVLARLLTRNDLCDPMPIARSALLDVLPDAVIVLNAEGRVAEASLAARRLPDMPAHLTGELPAAMGIWGRHIETLLAEHQESLALTVPGEPPLHYEISATRLEEDGIFCGQLLVLRDVTLRQNVELRLRAALDDLSAQLAENLRLQSELYGQARRDPLTNLYNRRALDEKLPALLADMASARQPVSVAMIDLDHFKKINDAFGHGFGDEVLKTFARTLQGMARPGDVLFRLGGEEFLAVLPDTTERAAADIVTRWLSACHGGLVVDGRELSLTFSAGVASTGDSQIEGSDLLAQADAAAYRAKREGRAQVITQTILEPAPRIPAVTNA